MSFTRKYSMNRYTLKFEAEIVKQSIAFFILLFPQGAVVTCIIFSLSFSPSSNPVRKVKLRMCDWPKTYEVTFIADWGIEPSPSPVFVWHCNQYIMLAFWLVVIPLHLFMSSKKWFYWMIQIQGFAKVKYCSWPQLCVCVCVRWGYW